VPYFLYPPYPGIQGVSAIFDHAYPNYSANNKYMSAPNGRKATCTTPSTHWTGCEYDSPYTKFGYDDHDGFDFRIHYIPVFAAANSNWVVAVGWYDPTNHKLDLGLRVILGHDLNNDQKSDYFTYYGHFSAISIPKCGYPAILF
jgi:hypothetical protein